MKNWSNGNIGVDPNYFYYVPTPTIPNGWPVYPAPTVYPQYPQYPAAPDVCPGCGRCRQCGQPAPPIVITTITCNKEIDG